MKTNDRLLNVTEHAAGLVLFIGAVTATTLLFLVVAASAVSAGTVYKGSISTRVDENTVHYSRALCVVDYNIGTQCFKTDVRYGTAEEAVAWAEAMFEGHSFTPRLTDYETIKPVKNDARWHSRHDRHGIEGRNNRRHDNRRHTRHYAKHGIVLIEPRW